MENIILLFCFIGNFKAREITCMKKSIKCSEHFVLIKVKFPVVLKFYLFIVLLKHISLCKNSQFN